MQCIICETELTGGLDTYGDRGQEVCQRCWFEHGFDIDEPESWYGLAPHKHAFDKDGNIIIGGTTFEPLPEPDANGDIVIDGYVFTPDHEAPGCGVWQRKK